MPRIAHLFMRRADLDRVPEPVLPPGPFSLRTYRPGDEKAWLEIIRGAYGGEWGDDAFERCVRSDEAFLPERLFFVTWNGRPIGTAGAFQKLFHGDRTGYVHMMAVLPDFRKRGLGAALLNACLSYFSAQGWRDAVLDTESARVEAIRLYLRNGFSPFAEIPGDEARWADVLRRIGVSG
jgi:ribosomal protein S18 acetylase RimI-like enzyme